MWHDYLNALVWATFPRSKLALHARQHRAVQGWLPADATQLPNARTRELDALALVDEGGVLLLRFRERELPVIFGHALFESLVFGQPAMIARAVVLDAGGVDAIPRAELDAAELDRSGVLRIADELLARVLENAARIVRPEELPRIQV